MKGKYISLQIKFVLSTIKHNKNIQPINTNFKKR